MKKAIEAAIALLKKAEADWAEKAKPGADLKTQKKANSGRNKARKEIHKAITILTAALKKNSGSGGEDDKPV